jgi:hypothetical protein
MAIIQTDTDKAYREQSREADRRWENEKREDEAIRQGERDKESAEHIAERYRHDNKGKSPP